MNLEPYNIVMQRTEGTGTGYAKNGITCARSLPLVKKHSAAPDHGVRISKSMTPRRFESISDEFDLFHVIPIELPGNTFQPFPM